MKLMTKLDIPRGSDISYSDSIMFSGSCFSEHIGQKFKTSKFKTLVNPFGILFNPISIMDSISRIINHHHLTEKDIFFHHGLWHSWMHHGRFSSPSKSECITHINSNIEHAHKFLKQANILILTFGTATVYTLKENGKIVANCHKVPTSTFEKRRLDIKEIHDRFSMLLRELKAFNPNLKILLTVSPVRHIRDGILENQRSKSLLLLATEQLCQLDHVAYFPSYEIMMDELRDYRFYNADLVHPNGVAVDYIWDKFRETYFNSSTEQSYNQVLKIVNGFQHQSLHPNTKEHHAFIKNHVLKAEKLMESVSVDFNLEISKFKGQLQLFKD